MRDQFGNVIGILGIYLNITEQKKIKKDLEEHRLAKEKAEISNLAKSEFLSSMSHELRTPLNAVIGFAQLMRSDKTLDAEQQECAETILKAGQHLLHLVDDILDLSKIESGRIDLNMCLCNLSLIVENCLSLVRSETNKRQISLSIKGEDEQMVFADPNRLRQIILNLLSNAIKYNREGGSIIVEIISISAEKTQIKIIDSGVGISDSDIKKLFEPFNRLGAERSNIEGIGIGLTITKQLIESMDGAINVESNLGEGSCFSAEFYSVKKY